MKKLLLVIVSAFVLSTSLWAKEVIPFSVHYEDNMPIGNGNPRSPIEVPLVYIEDYTLSFETNHSDYTLIIKDRVSYHWIKQKNESLESGKRKNSPTMDWI